MLLGAHRGPGIGTTQGSWGGAGHLISVVNGLRVNTTEDQVQSPAPQSEGDGDAAPLAGEAEAASVSAIDEDPHGLGELAGSVSVLRANGHTYFVLGTAHVSEKSVEEVQRLIRQVRPDKVCVELCDTRYRALMDAKQWEKLDIFKVIRQGKVLFLLANLAIGAYQRRLGAELGVKPGAELLAAAKAAEEVGAEVVLIDRDIRVTLKRTWAALGFFKRIGLLWTILESLVVKNKEDEAVDIEALKEKAHLSEMMADFAKALPEIHGALIDERDQYLVAGMEAAGGEKVVAVVGAGHVPGMKHYFGKPVDRPALETLPKPGWVWRVAKWIIPAIILLAFVYGGTNAQGRTLEEMLTAWILPNSVFAALFTILAGGRLVSIATAFVASPITSLNPLLGAGMVVGLVEAWSRKPTVEDCEHINDDVHSLRGLYKNAFTRVLLVAMAATLGSAMGAWVGLSWVLTLVAT